MKPNPQPTVTSILPDLHVLRAEIDRIDDQILTLLDQRYAAVQRVGWSKSRESGRSLAVRPRRERHIVDRLSAKASRVPREDVAQIWRTILSLSAHHQRAYRVILCGPESARLALTRVAAQRYGHSILVDWAGEQEALDAARRGDAILILPADGSDLPERSGLDLIGQHATGCIEHPWAIELGKLDHEERNRAGWSPTSWKGRIHRQMPAYADGPLARRVEEELRSAEPVVPADEIATLRGLLAEAQEGRSLLIQAGDCAESIEASSGQTLAMAELIDSLGLDLEEHTGLGAIRLGRLGGQYAKPRSRAVEEHGPLRLAAYRGDAVNGQSRCPRERRPDPSRLTKAHRQSVRVRDWLHSDRRMQVYTSHEALLLDYESALTRREESQSLWWAGSAHALWLGDRTRVLEGAHVDYLRGIANPVGIKCGPTLTPDELRRLLDRLDPEREPGRIMLISRLGHELVSNRLPPLMEAASNSGHAALWLCDPMHGNTLAVDGTKTRLVPHVIAEIRAFVRVARSLGVHPGGLHLEVTPEPVLECVDRLEQATPLRPFTSLCDPRLNAEQARQVVAAFASALEEGA